MTLARIPARAFAILLASLPLLPNLHAQTDDARPPTQDATDQQKPRALPAGKEALTWPRFYALRFAHNRKTDLADYTKHGLRDPKWDDVVTKGIEALHDLTSKKTPATRATVDAAYGHFTKALELGCKDPRVLYTVGRARYMAGDYKGLREAFAKARTGYRELGYPVTYEFYLQRALCSCKELQADPKELSKNLELLARLYGRATGDQRNKNGNQRYWLTTLHQTWRRDDDVPTDLAPIFAGMREVKAPDPWFLAYFTTLREIQSAWKARGNKWANETEEAQWARFHAHLGKAKTSCLKAHRLHPDFPEPAAQMLSILTGLEEPGLRTWFDRSVAAHFDYRGAYYKYIWALQPRWGGTNEALLAFGIECAKTKRHDTTVPAMLDRALNKIADDLGSHREAFRMKGAYDAYAVFVPGLLAAPPFYPEAMKRKFLGKYCLAGFVTGHRDQAAQTYSQLGKRLDAGHLRAFGLKESSVSRILEKRLNKTQAGTRPSKKEQK